MVNRHWKAKGHQTELEEKVKQLQRENEILRQERDRTRKKRYASSRSPSSEICVYRSSSKRISGASPDARVLGVSGSGYYAWRKQEPSQSKREDELLGE
ncbi:MAG TPA: hypothetical protein VFB12_10565 [Ktedonobacteraceae bacterium]|nr:hypothetical protein [Ktedonobacteraceae bacterium]